MGESGDGFAVADSIASGSSAIGLAIEGEIGSDSVDGFWTSTTKLVRETSLRISSIGEGLGKPCA
jgi:hypothetical protein